MKLRQLKQEEHNRTRQLYEEIFSGDSRSFVDYYYKEKTTDNLIYVVEDEGEITAMLHLNPYPMMVNGQKAVSHYIVAVATRPEYRKRGYMAALLRQALGDMYRNEEPFTYLMPAAEQIYSPHGFCTVYEQNQRYYEASDHEESGSSVRKAVLADCREIAELADAYLAEHYLLYAKRDTAYYERLLKEYTSDGGCLMVTEKGGRITDCRPYVEEPGEERAKIMVRVVNLKKLLSLLGVRDTVDVCFELTDNVVEENAGFYRVSGTVSHGLRAEAGVPGESQGTLTAAALTALVFGARTIEETAGEPEVSMSGHMKSELGKILPLSRIFLNEIV